MESQDASNPHAAYQRRLDRWRAVFDREQRRFIALGNWRLAVAAAGALLVWLALFREVLTAWWLLAPFSVFVSLVIIHDRVEQRRERARRAAQFYQRGIDRLEDRWVGAGSTGEAYREASQVYADDLDVFGKGSLFELLSTARTGAGERTLARWLMGAPAEDAAGPAGSPDHETAAQPFAGHTAEQVRAEVIERQEAVAELKPRLDLREDLALLGEEVRATVHPELLTAWAAAQRVVFPRWAVPLCVTLAGLAALSLGLWARGLTGARPFVYVLLVELIVALRLKGRAEHVVHAVDRPARELGILALLLGRLEREPFTSARLSRLHALLETERPAGTFERASPGRHVPASRLIARLGTLADRREWSDNLMFRLPARLLMWDELHAIAIESWRAKHGPAVPVWINVVGETEAFSSLASYAYEHPGAPFPEIAPSAADEGPVFDATAIRHPLMSTARCVPNDVRLDTDLRLLIISGSNMSGKSTLLRAVGLNAVLALAGAPVAGARLRLSPLAIGASIRVIDSLLDGRSRFYAEITRLRQVLDLTAGALPVLFLIDEMLHGTNSHDRRIGAEAVLRGLLERGAGGLITTHDLALADIADGLEPRAENVHFEDHLENGQMRFDYRLRSGRVRRSNALELMRSLGLLPES